MISSVHISVEQGELQIGFTCFMVLSFFLACPMCTNET